MPIEFAARTRRIPVYPLAAGYDLGADVAMLASNESCFAPLPSVVEAAGRAMAGAHRYPDPSYSPLRRALADRYGIPPQRIALGNGSCDILLQPARRCSSRGPRSSTPGPRSACTRTWPPPRAPGRSRCRSTTRTATTSTRSRPRSRSRPGWCLICNPNNPTSTALGLEEIDAFLKRIPSHVCVILDEAYCEFALALGDTYASLELLRKHPNLVLLRTFSKVYGLAALRVGYALCATEDFRIAVDQVRQPFYLNAAAQAAAVEALRHQDEVERRVTRDDRGAARAGGSGARAGAVGRAVGCELHLAAPARDGRARPTWWPDCETGGCSSGLAPRSGESARCA